MLFFLKGFSVVEVKQTGRPKSGYFLDPENRKGRVPSVTTLEENLTGFAVWSNRLGLKGIEYRSHMESLQKQGAAIHDAIELILHGNDPEPAFAGLDWIEHDGALNGLRAFRRWMDSGNVKIQYTEFPLVSQEYRFGGTPDGYGMAGSCPALFDWKSGRFQVSHLRQLGAYRQLVLEAGIGPVEEAHVVRFDRDTGVFSHKHLDSRALDFGWKSFLLKLEGYPLERQLRKYAT